MTVLNPNRRGVVQGLLAISAAGALAACGNAATDGADSSTGTDLSYASPTGFFSAEEMTFLAALAQTIMPKTDTAGAIEAGVPAVLQSLASEWGDQNYRKYWREGIVATNAALSTDGAFVDLPVVERAAVLGPYDAKVFGGQVEDQFYRDAKSTILQAYYMSEPGATQELAYEPVPGDWIGCAPLSDYPKSWAT